MKWIQTTLLMFLTQFGIGQNFNVLHYSETSGFDHQTRGASLAMFQSMGVTNNFQVDDDQTGDAFNSLSNLEQYDLVIFSNTSGDAILNATQRANFEAYINNGGSFLGIHAASDTYRHSTANGSNTGTWDFYAELVGASVQQSPNHVSGTPQYSMNHLIPHASTANLPDPWVKNEEYYYWENGFFGPQNNAVLEVEETIGPNNMVNSYDASRPMSWYRELSGGGKMFYTALGHAPSNFSSDPNFIQHISDAVLWIVAIPTGINETPTDHIFTIERVGYQLIISIDGEIPERTTLYTLLGQGCASIQSNTFNIDELPEGVYLLKALLKDQFYFRKVFISSSN